MQAAKSLEMPMCQSCTRDFKKKTYAEKSTLRIKSCTLVPPTANGAQRTKKHSCCSFVIEHCNWRIRKEAKRSSFSRARAVIHQYRTWLGHNSAQILSPRDISRISRYRGKKRKNLRNLHFWFFIRISVSEKWNARIHCGHFAWPSPTSLGPGFIFSHESAREYLKSGDWNHNR